MSALIDIEYIKQFVDEKDLLAHYSDENSQLDNTKLQGAIDRAHSTMFSMLFQIYQHPFAGDSESLNYLKSIEFRLTQYYLFNRIYKDDDMIAVRKDYEDALMELNRLAYGELKLPLTRVTAQGGVGFRASSPERIFTSEKLSSL